MTDRMKELFQKDKYELVDTIVRKEKSIDVLENNLAKMLDTIMKDCLYNFIDYYTQNDLDRVDLKVIADNFVQYGGKK